MPIQVLPLPSTLPSPEAIKSWGQNEVFYEADFWMLEYHSHRYLGRVNDSSLIARYDAIVRNMLSIIADERHVITIHSFLSSWYWYRKEYQTRLEFALRDLPLHRR